MTYEEKDQCGRVNTKGKSIISILGKEERCDIAFRWFEYKFLGMLLLLHLLLKVTIEPLLVGGDSYTKK